MIADRDASFSAQLRRLRIARVQSGYTMTARWGGRGGTDNHDVNLWNFQRYATIFTGNHDDALRYFLFRKTSWRHEDSRRAVSPLIAKILERFDSIERKRIVKVLLGRCNLSNNSNEKRWSVRRSKIILIDVTIVSCLALSKHSPLLPISDWKWN